jgi:hypothetical protein
MTLPVSGDIYGTIACVVSLLHLLPKQPLRSSQTVFLSYRCNESENFVLLSEAWIIFLIERYML